VFEIIVPVMAPNIGVVLVILYFVRHRKFNTELPSLFTTKAMTILHDVTVLLCVYIASFVVYENLKSRDYLGDSGLNGRIILKGR
jgi:hypothetical protein